MKKNGGVLYPFKRALFLAKFLPARRVVPAYRRLAYFTLKNLFTPLPFGAFFALTYRCDLACSHCFVADYKPSGAELSTSELKAFLDFLAGWGPFAVFFSGGEPLLRPDIYELVDYASARGLLVSLETNGLRLDSAAAGRLKEAGISNIRVSVDGAHPASHDAFRRRPGSFDKAVSALRECVRQGIRCVLVTCASGERARSGDLERVVALGREIGVDAVKILTPKILGRWKDAPAAALGPEELARLEALMDPSFVYPEQLKGTECYTRGRKYFCVNPYGEVQPCPSIPVSYGNIRETPPSEIMKRLLSADFEGHGGCGSCVSASPGFRGRMAALEGCELPVRIEKLRARGFGGKKRG